MKWDKISDVVKLDVPSSQEPTGTGKNKRQC